MKNYIVKLETVTTKEKSQDEGLWFTVDLTNR